MLLHVGHAVSFRKSSQSMYVTFRTLYKVAGGSSARLQRTALPIILLDDIKIYFNTRRIPSVTLSYKIGIIWHEIALCNIKGEALLVCCLLSHY